MSQFSLFGAAAATPGLEDLDGVLLGGGHWVRAGDTARLSVVVPDRLRADALAAEFAVRGVGGEVATADERWSARTDFAATLLAHARRWNRGANEGPPPGFDLTPGGLRLWAIAAGRTDEAGYLLATGRADSPLHMAAGAQLSRQGLAAVSLAQRPGPGWRITSAKRLRRLVELIGAAPEGAEWPGER